MKRLVVIALAFGAATGAVAQTYLTGAPLRAVTAAPGSAHLVYEYDAPGGPARLVVDPEVLLNDLGRIRGRAAPAPVAKTVSAPKAAPRPLEPAPEPAAAAPVEHTPEAAAFTESTQPPASERRNVRIIPLFNTPEDQR